MRLNEWIVLVLKLIARLTGPLLERRLARLALRLLPDLPHLEDYWTLEFEEPPHRGNKRTKRRVIMKLSQFGRNLGGIGHFQRSPQDSFTFTATIRRNVLYGSFSRSEHHILAGTGTFVLKIGAHSRRLEGHCLWYDGLLDTVWASPYRWKRLMS